MRLSEPRVNFITQQIAKELVASGLLEFKGSTVILESELSRILLEDLKIEEEIDREVVDMIDKMKRNIPQGSAEWNAIYFEKKEEIARRRNFVI